MTLIAPHVRPWNAPRNAMIPGRPVTRRASFSAASIASDPEFRKNTVSSGSGNVAGELRGEADRGLREAQRVDRPHQPVDLRVDRGGHAGMRVAQRGDGDPVGEVEIARPAVS